MPALAADENFSPFFAFIAKTRPKPPFGIPRALQPPKTNIKFYITAIVGVLCGWQAVWYVRRRIGARGAHPVELCYPLNRLKLLFLIRNHNDR